MEFADTAQRLAEDVRRKIEAGHNLDTEAATKQYLVLPFIQMLGYNPFELDDVVPEFTADIGTKKGEKVDYALMHDGSPSILIECKKVGSTFGEAELSQLMRYFTVTDARFGILTDGLVYQFYSDLEKPNVMDECPFLTSDVRSFGSQDAEDLEVLKTLTKDEFDIDKAIHAARRTKYRHSIKQVLRDELSKPSEEFLAFMRYRIDGDRRLDQTESELDTLIRQVCKRFIDEESRERTKHVPVAPSGQGVPVPSDGEVTTLWGLELGDLVVVGPKAKNESIRGKTGTVVRFPLPDGPGVVVQFEGGLRTELSHNNLTKVGR